MNARTLATICALLAALSNLIGCESSRSPDPQFQKQVMRAQECRQLQDKLVGDQPLTPERAEEIVLASPDVAVLMPCGFDLVRTRTEAPVLTDGPGWADLPASSARRVW